jgi:hypothetical protein
MKSDSGDNGPRAYAGADVLYISMAVFKLPACGGIQASSKGERGL